MDQPLLKPNQVLHNFNKIYSILSFFRARGFSVTESFEFTTKTSDYVGVFCYQVILLYFMYETFSSDFSNTGFKLLDNGVNYAMRYFVFARSILELKFFLLRFKLWGIAKCFNKCDSLVKLIC